MPVDYQGNDASKLKIEMEDGLLSLLGHTIP